MPPVPLAPIMFGLAAALIAATGWRLARSTTLWGPWLWAVFSLATLGLIEASIGDPEPIGVDFHTIRFASGVTLLCPLVALLGAKKPQDGPWHLIVASLLLILVLPAAESYLVRRGGTLQIDAARGWFLWILIAAGWINYLPTRQVVAVLMVSVGQIVYLAPQLPLLRVESPHPRIASGAILCGIALAFVGSRWPLSPASPSSPFDVDEQWAKFRNAYGMLWSLRIAERINAMIADQGVATRLGWYGLETDGRTPSDDDIDTVRRVMRSLLGRFVKKEWWNPR